MKKTELSRCERVLASLHGIARCNYKNCTKRDIKLVSRGARRYLGRYVLASLPSLRVKAPYRVFANVVRIIVIFAILAATSVVNCYQKIEKRIEDHGLAYDLYHDPRHVY